MAKKKIGLLFGGRSSEHEISLRSAEAVFQNIDQKHYEVVGIGIDRDGKWFVDQIPPVLTPQPEKQVQVDLSWHTGGTTLKGVSDSSLSVEIDLFFPMLHGPLYEDGAIQGVFELTNVPFVGCGVMASSLAMHKNVAKQLLAHHGIPVVPAVVVEKNFWKHSSSIVVQEVKKQLQYPMFVKPNNMGSSVGVHKVEDESSLSKAVDDAFSYDDRILIENGIDAREIEFAVLESIEDDRGPVVSAPGEIVPTGDFYSYEAKYIDDDGAKLLAPTTLDEEILKKAQSIAAHSFDALSCEGMARVDLFIDKKTNEIYVNELNTLPGFTSISMYPKLWEVSGIQFSELLTNLIELGFHSHRKKQKLKRDCSAAN